MDGNMWDGFFTDEAEETGGEIGAAEQEEEQLHDGGGEGLDGEGGNPSGGDPEDETGEAEDGGEGGEDNPPEGGFDAELEERINRETQKRVDAAIAKQFAGVKNPYTDKPITTEAELAAYRAAYAAEQQRLQLEGMGIDQNQLNDIVQNLPEVQQARQMLARQQQEQAKNMMQEQFDALKREYPDCGYADTAAMLADVGGRKVLELWRDSPKLSIADAYLLMNKDKIRKQQNAAVKQGALNQMNGKKHLTQTKGNNGKGDVPPEIRDSYKVFMPDATDDEIRKMYFKNRENSEN